MKAYVNSSTEEIKVDYIYTVESVYSLLDLIRFLPDSDTITFSVQDLKKLIGVKTESSIDFSLK